MQARDSASAGGVTRGLMADIDLDTAIQDLAVRFRAALEVPAQARVTVARDELTARFDEPLPERTPSTCCAPATSNTIRRPRPLERLAQPARGPVDALGNQRAIILTPGRCRVELCVAIGRFNVTRNLVIATADFAA